MRIYAVVPAAGLGSRFSTSVPKILARVTETETIWSILRKKLLTIVEHINVIVSPKNEAQLRAVMREDIANNFVSLSLQPEPIGMGDAIFRGYPVWSKADIIIVVWGDQIYISQETLLRALANHGGSPKTVTIPLARLDNPYVEYCFDHQHLMLVKQSREGDQLSPTGLSDVGAFVLSVEHLSEIWEKYRLQNQTGNRTGEINFLPFLPWLSSHDWRIKTISVSNSIESRGINTQADLEFFQNLYQSEVLA